jgi:DNA-binding MarR family transcriptional regulator
VAELFQQRRAELAGTVGLTEHQWGVLEEISSEHFMPSMFARQRESSQAAVSKTLRQLSDKGLIETEVPAGDGRRRSYQLTEMGKRVMRELRKQRERAIEHVWSRLPERSLQDFISVTDELAQRMDELLQKDKRG